MLRRFGDDLGSAQLMLGAQERIEEADGDRGCALGDELPRGLSHVIFAERDQHLAVGVHPFGDLCGAPQRYEWTGFAIERIDHVRAGRLRPAASLINGRETAGDDQSADGAFGFQKRIGGHRRAVHETVDLAWADIGCKYPFEGSHNGE